nr:hypothetical protein [Tanacetum cinerariifolium]
MEETCHFVEAPIKCNLKQLADVSERLTIQDHTNSLIKLMKAPTHTCIFSGCFADTKRVPNRLCTEAVCD